MLMQILSIWSVKFLEFPQMPPQHIKTFNKNISCLTRCYQIHKKRYASNLAYLGIYLGLFLEE